MSARATQWLLAALLTSARTFKIRIVEYESVQGESSMDGRGLSVSTERRLNEAAPLRAP